MILVGLTGDIGSGKTTFANYLSEHASPSQHWETWQVVAEVATALRTASPQHPVPDDVAAINVWLEPLPAIVKRVTGRQATLEQLQVTGTGLQQAPENYAKLFEYLGLIQKQSELSQTPIDESNKELFRSLLQWLGGYLVKMVDPGIWYDELVRRIQSSDAIALATVGGVRFPGDAERLRAAGGVVIGIIRPSIESLDQQDVTERERRLIVPDTTVYNEGTLVQLEACATRVLTDLQAGHLQSSYSTNGPDT